MPIELQQPDLSQFFGTGSSTEPVELTESDLHVCRHTGIAPADVAAFKRQRSRGVFTLAGGKKPFTFIVQQ